MVNEIIYNPDVIQKALDNTARKVVKENFDAHYSPLFNNCGQVAMQWFSMGIMPNSNKTFGEQMAKDSILKYAGISGVTTLNSKAGTVLSAQDFYKGFSPNQNFNYVNRKYAK